MKRRTKPKPIESIVMLRATVEPGRPCPVCGCIRCPRCGEVRNIHFDGKRVLGCDACLGGPMRAKR